MEMGVVGPHDHSIINFLIITKHSRDNRNTAGIASFSSGSKLEEEIGDTPFVESTSRLGYETFDTVGFGPSKITGCRFDGNTASEGGAIYTSAGYDMIVDSSFTRNFAGNYLV